MGGRTYPYYLLFTAIRVKEREHVIDYATYLSRRYASPEKVKRTNSWPQQLQCCEKRLKNKYLMGNKCLSSNDPQWYNHSSLVHKLDSYRKILIELDSKNF